MPAQLTLVADNRPHARRPAAGRRIRPQDASPTADASWVHSAWTPRPGSPSAVERRSAHGAPTKGRPERADASIELGSRPLEGDRGAVTAEYAIVIMAGVAFAGLMVAIMRSGEIRQMLVDLVQNALGTAG